MRERLVCGASQGLDGDDDDDDDEEDGSSSEVM